MKYLIRNSVLVWVAGALTAPVAFADDTDDTKDATDSTGAADTYQTGTAPGTTAPPSSTNDASTSSIPSGAKTSPSSTTTKTTPSSSVTTDPSTTSRTMPSGSSATGTSPIPAADIGARYQVIDFKEGSSEIPQIERQKLRTLVDNAKSRGQIAQIHAAVWSDKPFPQEGQNLNKADRKLAQTRAEKLEKYLGDYLAVSGVETHNMAEHSGFVASNFNKEDAELKSAFSKRGATPMSSEDFQVIKQMGGPSKAVVVVELIRSSVPD